MKELAMSALWSPAHDAASLSNVEALGVTLPYLHSYPDTAVYHFLTKVMGLELSKDQTIVEAAPHKYAHERVDLPGFEGNLNPWLKISSHEEGTWLKFETADGASGEISNQEKTLWVLRVASYLSSLGLKKGDILAMGLPRIWEGAVVRLAALYLGLILRPLAPGADIDVPAKALVHLKDDDVVFTSHVDLEPLQGMQEEATSFNWADLETIGTSNVAEPAHLSGDDVVSILSTSGTTSGKGKLVKLPVTASYKYAMDMWSMDVKPGSVVCYPTDYFWMMGMWLVDGASLLGATMVITSVNIAEDAGYLWNFVNRHDAEFLGVSPDLMSIIRKKTGDKTIPKMPSLRGVFSTGMPWRPKTYRWMMDDVMGGDVPIINYSGGTEVGGGAVIALPFLDIPECGFNRSCLGVKTAIYDESGELADTQGWLASSGRWFGMTTGPYYPGEPPEGAYQAFLNGYYLFGSKDIWTQGDEARWTDDGMIILGRYAMGFERDGKRYHAFEVQCAAEEVEGVASCDATTLDDGNELGAFIVLNTGADQDTVLSGMQKALLAEFGFGFNRVIFEAVPRTGSGKAWIAIMREKLASQPAL